MNVAKLALLACPSFLAFVLLVPPVYANETANKPSVTEIVFERPTSKSVSNVTAQQPDDASDSYDCDCSSESPMLNFTDKDSNAAIKRYGCDCAGCMNAVRQLQGKLPIL
ncbi:MAG TPA: hypothetical protein V6D09_09255 [Leptolyngbyaceae cyanobacterium]